MADDPLDELYSAPLEEFTALRKRLTGEARKSGDADAAKRISGARKPTTAAWVVNRLAIADDSVTRRLTELGQRLRDAHAAMDGDRIREGSAEQRRLVDELARAALAGLKPTGSLRDDVTGTLQAAVADPDVAARLGRLTKAETWSGFGEFGDTAIVVSPTARRKPEKPEKNKEPEQPAPEKPRDDRDAAARRERQQARADLAAAERARGLADGALAELQSDLAAARMRHQDAQRRLQDAERALIAAEDAYDKGKQTSRDAAATVKEAKARLRRIT